jgi:hypothetical protein
MRNILTLDLEALTVDSFPTTPAPEGPQFLYVGNRPWTDPTSGPCLDSQQTCGPECIA